MNETTKLKPCPFCGGSARMASEHDMDGFGMFRYVECRQCHARSRPKYHGNGNDCPQFYQEVRDAWNSRILPSLE